MRIKIPALILLCAAAGWLVPSGLNAEDDKKPAETRKTEQTKKSEAAKNQQSSKKPESKKRKPSRRAAVEAELKKLHDQLAEKGKELDKAHESLHTAQKELAAKSDAIKSLECKKCENETALKKANEELKKFKSSDFNKLAHTLDAERKKNAELQSQLKVAQKKAEEAIVKAKAQATCPACRKPAASEPKKPEPKKPEPKKPEPKKPEPKKPETKKPETKKPEPKKPEPKKPEPKKPEPKKSEPKKSEPKKSEPKKPAPKKEEPKKPTQSQAPTIAPILYDLNSAVNYQERVRVLKELRAILKKSPNAKIQITGYADDSPYRQANDEVASNRAKFLLKYLCLSGVPEKQLSSRGVGSAKQGRGKGNRRAVIQIRN